jgi:hypothetical protein
MNTLAGRQNRNITRRKLNTSFTGRLACEQGGEELGDSLSFILPAFPFVLSVPMPVS